MFKKSSDTGGKTAGQMIEQRIEELGGWRGRTLARLRSLVRAADPDVVEEWKWGVPVWSHGGILCTGEAYKNAVKMTFAKGASLADPSKLFNSSLGGGTRRAIDFHEGGAIDEEALKGLIRAAVSLNTAAAKPARKAASAKRPARTAKAAKRPARTAKAAKRPAKAAKRR